MRRRSFLGKLAAASLLAAGCQTVEENACEVEILPVLPARGGGRLIIQVDTQHFVDEAIWLAEHLRAGLLKDTTLMVEPIVVGLPVSCPQASVPVPSPIEVPIDLVPEAPESDETLELEVVPAAPVIPASFEQPIIAEAPFADSGTRLRILVDDFHPYMPMRLSVTLLFESAATGLRYNTFQNTWTGPMDHQPIADSSAELRRRLIRPQPETASRFNSVVANSPREFLLQVAEELVPTVVSSAH